MRTLMFLVAAACHAAGGFTAAAGVLYTVGVSDPKQPGFGGQLSSSSPGISVSDSFDLQNSTFPERIDRGNGLAIANQGRVGAAVEARRNFQAGGNREVNAFAEFRIDDLEFTASNSNLIDVVLPLHLSGMMNASGSFALVSVEATLAGQRQTGLLDNLGRAEGLVSGLNAGTIDTTLNASFTDIAPNTLLGLRIKIGVQVFVNGDNTAFSNFGSTFGFVSDGPTFIVDQGISVNSAQAGIVDNQFGAAAVVPEPASLALWTLMGSLVALMFRGRRVCNG